LAPRSYSLRAWRRASTADPAQDAESGRVRGLRHRGHAVCELVRDAVVRADELPRHSAESLLEVVRAVHWVVLSGDVHGNSAEVESARAALACFDDAPPEERVRGVRGAA